MLTTEQPKTKSKQDQKSLALPAMPRHFSPEPAGVSGVLKTFIAGGFILSLVAFTSSVFLLKNLNTAKAERSAIEASRIQLEDRNESLIQEKNQADAQLLQIRDQLKNFSAENAKIKKDLDQTFTDLSNARKKIRILEEDNLKLSGQVTELKQTQITTPSAAEADTLVPASAETAPDAVLPEKSESQPPAESAAVEDLAQVMTVNRKFNFVVINLGLKDNLKMGDQLSVLRDNKPVAAVQVEKLYDRFAAATILNESGKDKVEKGDSVRKI